MNDCLTAYINITATSNGIPVTLPVAATLQDQEALITSRLLPLTAVLITRSGQDVHVEGSLGSCCQTLDYTEVLGACPDPVCGNFALCTYLNLPTK